MVIYTWDIDLSRKHGIITFITVYFYLVLRFFYVDCIVVFVIIGNFSVLESDINHWLQDKYINRNPGGLNSYIKI